MTFTCPGISLLLGESKPLFGDLASLLLAAGAALLIFLTIIRMRQRYAQSQGDGTTAKERLASIRRKAAARDEVGSAMADVEELTRRCAAILDNKAERLEYLLEIAEARIAELEQTLGERPGARSHAAPQSARDDESPPGEMLRFAASADAEAETERASSAGSTASRPPKPIVPERAMDPLTRQIYELADEGATPVEIARKLDEQVGKVELILALRAG